MFSQKTFEFLLVNKMNDSREFFHSHKDEYEAYVLKPLIELCESLSTCMISIDPQIIAEPKVGKAISRIYRDTRFSRDKSLYRDVMWLAFGRSRKGFPDAPAFVFEISPKMIRWGVGYYAMPPKLMEAVREMVLENHPLFQKTEEAQEKDDCFPLVGECFKKAKYKGDGQFKTSILNRKCVCFLRVSDDFSMLDESLASRLCSDFLSLKSHYDFLLAASERYRMKEETL